MVYPGTWSALLCLKYRISNATPYTTWEPAREISEVSKRDSFLEQALNTTWILLKVFRALGLS